MRHCIQRTCLIALLGAFAAPTVVHGADDAPPAAKLTKEDNRVVVQLGGKPFTDYYYGPDAGHTYIRPFMWPVHAADGAEVTSDQLRAKEANPKEDHPHHRSIYVAQGDVNGADHWSLLLGAEQPKQRHVKFEKVDGDTLVEDLEWEGKDHQPILKETRTVRFFAFPDGNRGIDLTSTFSPMSAPVTFGETKEAGLCSVRLAEPIAKTSTITESTGVTSTSEKTEKEVWGKKADWCDESGQLDGKTYGVAVLDHPSNPRHPSNWHVRHYGLLAANVFGLHDFDKSLPKDAGAMTMELGKPITFRYRVVIHTGDAKSAQLDEKYKEFK